MSTWTLRRFCRPDVLKEIRRERLLAFLTPHREFLASRKLVLPAPGHSTPLDYEQLTGIFMNPDVKTPGELIDALYFVDELATPENVDGLLKELERHGIHTAEETEHSPADLVVQLWLVDRTVLERKHIENYLERMRSFESYQMEANRPPPFKMPSATQLDNLTADLDQWFETRRRGRGSRVIVSGQPPAVWFLVRHGEPLKREESLVSGAASSICHQPIRYDVLVYNTVLGELQINASSPKEKDFYRTAFGKHLFDDINTFPGADKYTLDPLRKDGEACLVATDVAGIQHVTLQEVQLYFAGEPWEMVTRKSNDFFRLLTSRDSGFPESGKLQRAVFAVQFSGARKPRRVVIKPPNVAQFARDEDAGIVERWLIARGFIRRRVDDEAGEADSVLASA